MSMLNTLNKSGHQPNIHILDNEVSSSMRQVLLKNKIKYQLVPQSLQRQNAAEHAIQKFKAHFITCICAANPGYPEKEWDCFPPQVTLALNLLRKCHFNPKLLADAALHGTFDYKKHRLPHLEP